MMQAAMLPKQAVMLQQKIVAVAAMPRSIIMKTDGNTCSCSNSRKDHKQTAIKDPEQKKYLRRSMEFVKMMVPAFVFAVIPKCPVCLAGYIALSTGIGLSITTATYLRT